MQFFDANVYVGRFKQMNPGRPFTREALLADMTRFGIAEALVIDTASREVHPSPGNARVLQVCKDEPRLHPCWALIPHRTGEIGPLDTLLDRMHTAGVCAARLFPGHYTFSLEEWCVGPLLDVLEEGRIPTFIDPNPSMIGGWPPDSTDWEAVVRLCRAHPSLPVIISENRLRSANRMMYQALDACPNLRFELSGFWVHRGIEFVCREFGAERLLFGTKWPLREIGGEVATVAFAQVTDEERALIAGENLRDLMLRAHPRRPLQTPRISIKPPTGNTLRARAIRGEPPADEVIIDAHAHLGQAAIYHLADSTPSEVELEMERLGVRSSVVFGYSGVIGDWTLDNDLIARAMKAFPGRYLGLFIVNPNSPDEMRAEMARCEGKGFLGVKLIAGYQGYPEDGPNIEIPLAWANERRLLVLNHGWGPPEFLKYVVEKYPNVTYVVGHYALQYADIVNKHPNVYQCTCDPLGYNAMETLVEAIDIRKIVFGSDITDLPLPLGMGPILHARLSDTDKRRILGWNAMDMLSGLGVAPLKHK